MDWTNITKEEFDNAYNYHLPNWWVKFAFKYFSKETEVKNMKLRKWLIGFLFALFCVGMLGKIFHLSEGLVGSVTIIYSIILAILVLSLFAAVFMNNYRLKKVAKILGVTKQQYNWLADKYY